MIHPFRWLWDNVWWPWGVRVWKDDLAKADHLRSEGRYDESRAVLRRLLKVHRGDATAIQRLRELEHAPELDRAMTFYEGGDADEAERLLRQLVAEHPAFPEARLHLAWVLEWQGRSAEAAEEAAAGAALDPTGFRTLLIAAEVTIPADTKAAENYLARIDELLAKPGERERQTRLVAQVAHLRQLIAAAEPPFAQSTLASTSLRFRQSPVHSAWRGVRSPRGRSGMAEAPRHVNELSPEEAHAAFDEAAHYYLQMSGDEFLQRWAAGEFAADDPAVMPVAMLLPLVGWRTPPCESTG